MVTAKAIFGSWAALIGKINDKLLGVAADVVVTAGVVPGAVVEVVGTVAIDVVVAVTGAVAADGAGVVADVVGVTNVAGLVAVLEGVAGAGVDTAGAAMTVVLNTNSNHTKQRLKRDMNTLLSKNLTQ